MNIAEILNNSCWSIICQGGDEWIGWVVVGYYMAPPHERVLGYSDEYGGVEAAIKMALETTKESQYDYLYEYKGRE